MSEAVIFPARTSLWVHGKIRDEVLFEVYSPNPMNGGKFKRVGKTTLHGETWLHYTALLGQDEHKGFLTGNCNLSENHASYISSSLFEKALSLHHRPKIMGIVNVTPDSFYPGSRVLGKPYELIDRLMEQGPDIVDVGGESTRPGSGGLEPVEEISRIKPVLEYLSSSYDVPISLDTRNPETAEFSLKYGIQYLNDVSGFENPEMIEIAAENSLGSIVMHMRGKPQNMQENTQYSDLILELNMFFQKRALQMVEGGIHPSRIIVDPGIGFGKGLDGNKEIIRELESLNTGYRILAGASRKTFIGRITGEPVERRLAGTLATSIYLMNVKCDIVRVHDVKENRDAVDVYSAIEGN